MSSADIIDEFQQNFLDYAASVNWDRAIPRVQDGLKPVTRRILWGMYEGKYFSNKAEVKSAKIVGDVMGNYHPHGDSSIYEAMIRLSKEWIMPYPLIDIHGNKGNVGGDGPAAMRYTEGRLTKLVEDSSMTALNKNIVPMINNYDDTLQEPEILPSIFPNILCSPNQGIGVAQACYWLPHNLEEIAKIIVTYMNTGELQYDELYPDFPLGGTIVNKNEISKIYTTGKGKVVVEGKYKIENNKIIFYEQPYEVTTEALVQKLKDIYEEGKLTQIADFQDQSGKKGFRLVFELVPKANTELALNELFSYSDLRKSYGANNVAIRDLKKGPELLTLKDIIDCYIEHNTTCIRREHEYDFGKAKSRIEILEGLLKALDCIDKTISLIRSSKDTNEAKDKLIQELGVSDNQAKAILDMKLARLSNLDGMKIEEELEEKKQVLVFCESIIESYDKQKEILIERLTALVKKYGKPRKTKVEQKTIAKPAGKAKTKTEEVPQDVVVTFDGNYFKAIPVAQYRKKKGQESQELKTTTMSLVLCFSSLGKFYRISPKEIGLCGNADKGKAAGAILKLEANEKILYITSNEVDKKHPYLTCVTNNGLVKKSEKTYYMGNVRNLSGMKYIGLADNEVVFVAESNGDILSITSNDGYRISFQLDEVRPTGKTSKGMIGIKLNDNANVKVCAINDVISKNAVQKRGGKGKKIC